MLKELLSAPDCFGSTPLHIAAVTGNCACMELLLHHIKGLDNMLICVQDNDGYHPTAIACSEYGRVVAEFTEKYPGFSLLDCHPALHNGEMSQNAKDGEDDAKEKLQAKAWGILICLNLLVTRGYPIDSVDYSMNTMFHSLAYCLEGEALNSLLETIISNFLSGSSPQGISDLQRALEIKNDNNWTCFHIAHSKTTKSLTNTTDTDNIVNKEENAAMHEENSFHSILIKYTSSTFLEKFDPVAPKAATDGVSQRVKCGAHRRIPYEDRYALLKNSYNLEGVAKFLLNLPHTPRVVVIAGAGISTSAGIPDFRSGNGLYANKATAELFSTEFLHSRTEEFYAKVRELFLPVVENIYKPTASHALLRLLYDCGWLTRVYTQNIDMLEHVAFKKVDDDEVNFNFVENMIVECHGSMRRFKCTSQVCAHVISRNNEMQTRVWERIRTNQIPICPECGSLLRPDVTFFGEPLPEKFHQQCLQDLPNCDLLLVIGTSLLVYPVASLPQMVGSKTVRMLWNREAFGCFQFIPAGNEPGTETEAHMAVQCDTRGYRDVFHRSDCDNAAAEFATLIGKLDEFQSIIENCQS